MIKFSLDKKADDFDFEVADLDFYEILETEVSNAQIDTVRIGRNKEVVVTLDSVENDKVSFEIRGEFDVKALDGKRGGSIEDAIKEINEIVVIEGKSEVFTISGLKLKPEDFADGAALLDYVSDQSFSLQGSDGDNVLGGGSRGDKIDGERGDDILTGGQGDDDLTGGKGADMFIFNIGDGDDVITDFRAKGRDQDIIDLSAYDITYADLSIEASGKREVEISFGDDSIVLEGVKFRDIDEGDFIF